MYKGYNRHTCFKSRFEALAHRGLGFIVYGLEGIWDWIYENLILWIMNIVALIFVPITLPFALLTKKGEQLAREYWPSRNSWK